MSLTLRKPKSYFENYSNKSLIRASVAFILAHSKQIASKANIFRIFDYSKNLTWKIAKNTSAKIKSDF